MQKLSIRKFSILGVVLMGASAVTAAMLPNKVDKNAFAAGSLTAAATSRVTCSQTNAVTPGQACNASTGGATVTTAGAVDSASVSSASGDFGAGQDNTSDAS